MKELRLNSIGIEREEETVQAIASRNNKRGADIECDFSELTLYILEGSAITLYLIITHLSFCCNRQVMKLHVKYAKLSG